MPAQTVTSGLRVQALFGKKTAAPAKKAAAPAKKGAAAPKKSAGSKTSGGWLGSNSTAINLDKWCAWGTIPTLGPSSGNVGLLPGADGAPSRGWLRAAPYPALCSR